jgi:hypothetical protein
VAPAGGGAILETSETFGNLRSAMTMYGDPQVAFTVRSWRPAFFQVAARVDIAPAHDPALAAAAIEAHLRETFSFDRRSFGQDVVASEVIAAIHGVPGVVVVELVALWKTNPSDADLVPTDTPPPRLQADAPVPGARSAEVQPGEILMLDPRPVSLTMTRVR